MIYDTMDRLNRYDGMGERFRKAFDFMRRADLDTLPVGRYPIDGSDVYAMVQAADLKESAQVSWEAHRRYVDIQFPLDGIERIDVRFTNSDEVGPHYSAEKDIAVRFTNSDEVGPHYSAEKDIAFLEEKPGTRIVVRPGEWLMLFPEDAHRPCVVADEEKTSIRKVVVKVRVEIV